MRIKYANTFVINMRLLYVQILGAGADPASKVRGGGF